MKLEAVDKKNPDLTCVASINNVIGDYFLVHFDEWDDTYDYWCTETCPYLHPTGWCKDNGIRLTPPQGISSSCHIHMSYLVLMSRRYNVMLHVMSMSYVSCHFLSYAISFISSH